MTEEEKALLQIIHERCQQVEQALTQYLVYEPVEEYDPEATRLCIAHDAAEERLSEAVLALRLLYRRDPK